MNTDPSTVLTPTYYKIIPHQDLTGIEILTITKKEYSTIEKAHTEAAHLVMLHSRSMIVVEVKETLKPMVETIYHSNEHI